MAQQFSYDEKGSTFLYFLLSFFAMILIPLTYLMWPKTLKEEEKQIRNQRDIHGKSKWYKKKQEELRRKKSKPSIRKVILVLSWIGFIWLVYKVSSIEHDHVEYNPYEVLGVSEDANKVELKKRFRQLVLEKHPDKGGDPEEFMRIRKAYDALTDEDTMQNWKDYGNPDGPQAMEFGIALPKWIVESQNSFVVLSVYMFLFMIALPLVVGLWWNRSIKYSKEQVLLDTTQLFYHFINKTPNMNLKRALTIFSGSFEFSHDHNNQVRTPAPEDNEDIPDLIHQLESCNIVDNTKDRPFNFPYSVKARVLIYSHLSRLDVTSQNLQGDIDYILRKSPLLIQEMVNCIAQLTTMAHWNKANLPRLESLENVMKIAPMMVQGLRDTKSSLLQLPYFNDEFVKFCNYNKRQSVRGLKNLVEMRESDRRQMLRRMGDEEYDTMLTVLRSFPLIDLDVSTHVIDDEETNVITAGAIVTVTVFMKRGCLGDLQELDASPEAEVVDDEDQEVQDKQPKLKPWEKQGKKKKNLKKKKPVKALKKPVKKTEKTKTEENSGAVEEVPQKTKDEEGSSGSESDVSDSDSDAQPNEDKEEREWQAMQATFKRKEKVALEVKDRRTHTVYAPYLPVEKQEWWWVYACDRKKHLLLTSPVLVTNLREEEEIELKFPAPTKPGRYTYSVWIRSDSYFDCDQKFELKLDVKEAKPVEEDHPQWNISDDEQNGGADESEDEGISSEEQSSSEE
uniref:Translocation protein SEC63 homolog n=1 Tax=Phallusia mammillata TaxID=59560 RepID=A0A6F9DR76_9ASCI|nr:translocation protein SEC63 homolog [Phallusia mammillata]